MVMQYPYELQVFAAQSGTQDSSGDWIAGTTAASWVKHSMCRIEKALNKTVRAIDGNNYTASFVVYCPVNTLNLNLNDEIRIIESDGSERLTGRVIFSEKNQLYTKLWV